MSESSQAVFLSYASADAPAARALAAALRAAGLEVWGDPLEAAGQEGWDLSTRRQIRECALFVPVISSQLKVPREPHLKLQWKLAVRRARRTARRRRFLVPVTIDRTTSSALRLPAEFVRARWTRLPRGEVSPAFLSRVVRLVRRQERVERVDPTRADESSEVIGRFSPARWLWPALGAALVMLGAGAWLWTTREVSPTIPNPPPQAESPAVPGVVAAPTVAVLAFENRSGNAADDYLAEGLSEELIGVLQKFPGVRVTARPSAFSFRGRDTTIQEIGRTLEAAYVVSGVWQRTADGWSLRVELSRTDTGDPVWAETFQTVTGEAWALRRELAGRIVSRIKPQASAAVPDPWLLAWRGGTQQPAADDAYLQGRYHGARLNREDVSRAIRHLQRAVELDGTFALAWAALGALRTTAVFYGFEGAAGAGGMEAAISAARQAVDQALTLEPDLPEGLAARASIQIGYDFAWQAAQATLDRGIGLAPEHPQLVQLAAQLATDLGRTDEALDLSRQAVALDPLNAGFRLVLAGAYADLGRFADAASERARALELSPGIAWGHAGRALDLLRQGKAEEAVAAAEQEKTAWCRLTVLAVAYWQLRETQKSDAALARLIETTGDFAAYQIAEAHAFRGESDLAFKWLDRALRQRDGGLQLLQVDPLLANLRSDPRWPEYLRKMGFADEQSKPGI